MTGEPTAAPDGTGVAVLGTGPGTLLCRMTSGNYRFTADDPILAVP